MRKTRKINKGGKAIASGGYGCVFDPALKCQDNKNRAKNKISKLMTEKHAIQEYEEIHKINEKLDKIPNYQDYFLVYDATLCRPDKLSETDLHDFNDKCTALPKDDITKANINTKLDEIMVLNLPNGGLPVDDYIYESGSFEKIYKVHIKLISLLKNGIIPMNKNHIYHCDIKDSNVLVDTTKGIKTRLIDWGLAVNYRGNDDGPFPKNWRNRPLQFNVPFSVILFTDIFYENYTNYLKKGGEVNEMSLKPFVINYLNEWMKHRGAGHYKFINEILYKIYNTEFTTVSEKNMPLYIETEITIPIIVDYIVEVLVHYTKFKENGELNLREYLNDVFIKIIDVYGFINIYYPLIELLSNNYFSLNKEKLKLFNALCNLYKTYLYSPRHTPYNMKELFGDLKEISILLNNITDITMDKYYNTSKKTTSKTTSKRTHKLPLFRRKPLVKRFKKPIFLSFK